MVSEFSYQPLSTKTASIRLLTLHCDNGSDLTGELQHVTFASKPSYEALSYASIERSGATRQIVVNGSKLEIPEEIFHALKSICARATSRTLWLESICVNEQDISEKNYQRAIKYMIYSRAKRVIVWLGVPEHPIVDDGRHGGFSLYGENHKASKEMAASPYWTDAWTVQDIGLAKDLHLYFGTYCIPWQQFHSKVMNSSGEMTEVTRLLLNRKLKEFDREGWTGTSRDLVDEIRKPLESLLEEFRDTQCREPQDKIFAFLSLASDWSDDIIDVDYRMSFYELYTRTIDFQQTRPLLVDWDLRIKSDSLDRSLRLIGFSQLVQKLLGGKVNEDARNPNVQKVLQTKFYTVRGALCSEIEFLGPSYLQCISSSRSNVQWKRDLEAHFRKNPEDLRKARQSNEKYAPLFQDWTDEYVAKLKAIHSECSYGYQEDAETTVEVEKQPLTDEETPKGPRRFLGTNGIIGFVPPETRIGDSIYTFWKCDVAVVLRKAGLDRWTLIGRADVAPIDRYAHHQDTAWHNALMLDVATQGRGYTMGVGETFPHMMNLKVDLDTLQKLTN